MSRVTSRAALRQSGYARGPRGGSEYDPARPGVPRNPFRTTMAPVSESQVTVTRQPTSRPPAGELDSVGADEGDSHGEINRLDSVMAVHRMTAARKAALRKAQIASARRRRKGTRPPASQRRKTVRKIARRTAGVALAGVIAHKAAKAGVKSHIRRHTSGGVYTVTVGGYPGRHRKTNRRKRR
jgi:hypothetical protein